MKFSIADRFRTFSHSPGHCVLIPITHWNVQAFPAALVFTSPLKEKMEISLGLKGPVCPFTVEQDLEKKEVRVYGESIEGYFRFRIKRSGSSLSLIFDKTPREGIFVSCTLTSKVFKAGESLEIATGLVSFESTLQERLFLGVSKQKECSEVRRRKDLREILPFWHALGTLTPPSDQKGSYQELESAIGKRETKQVSELLFHTYLAHFSEGFVPRDHDEERQGIVALQKPLQNLLQAGSAWIRSLFFQEKEDGFHILPCVPSQFICGKMIQIQTQSGYLLDLEWTKRRIRKMRIVAAQNEILQLHFPSTIKEFRLRTSLKDRGRTVSAKEANISVRKGDVLLLDRFEK